MTGPEPFVVRDCTMTALATGLDARNLRELRDRVQRIPEGSLDYHFWGRLLRPVIERREYNNDFANWAAYSLRDRRLAERLALVDPADFPDLEHLRDEMVEVLEDRLAESAEVPWAISDEAFHFIQGQLVVFDTHRRLERPEELVDLCPRLSLSSVYYHFVDARNRSEDGVDDFQRWVNGVAPEQETLGEHLRRIDLSFVTLEGLREELHQLFRECFGDGAERGES